MTEQTERKVEQLRYDARLAFLDGRNKRARDLNKQADKLEAEMREKAKTAAPLSFNDVHQTLNKWCRQGHIADRHLVSIVREVVSLSKATA